MEQAFQLARSSISANLQTTTLMPNHRIAGILTFAIPSTLRSAKDSRQFTMTIQVGPDRHVLTGHAGPIGTIPAISPSPELATYLAQRIVPPAPVSKPASVQPQAVSSRATLATNQRVGGNASAAPPVPGQTAGQPTRGTRQKTKKAAKEDWGLVAVPSQLGY